MVHLLKCYLISIFFATALMGCAVNSSIIPDSHKAAEILISQAPDQLQKDSPILVVSFVNIDNLEKTTTLGRLLSEQVASKISQMGYNVKEIKLSYETLFVREREGEFALSRKLKHIKKSFDANYIIVGTYSPAARSVYVTSRIVRIDDSRIVASYDFRLIGNADLWELVKENKGGK